MKTISIVNAKGGVAKTTTALNLASFLAKKHRRVLLLDFDPQANATKTFLDLGIGEVAEGPSMYDVLYSYIMDNKKNIITEAIKPVQDNLSLISATLRMEQFKDLVKANSRRPLEVLKELLKPLQNQFDYLVIDCPADMSIYVENAIEVADQIICPATYDFYGIDGLSLIIPTILEIKGEDFDGYKVLYTIYNSRATKIHKQLGNYASLLEQMNKVFDFKVPVDQSVKNSQAESLDLMQNSAFRNSRARLAYQKLGTAVLETMEVPQLAA